MRRLFLLLGLLLTIAAPAVARDTHHRLVVHIDSADPKVMSMGLHNAENVAKALRDRGEAVTIEIVANGPGTAMFIESLSPVKDDVAHLHTAWPAIVLSACGVSMAHLQQELKQALAVLPVARVVPSGAVRIMELQEQDWGYMKP